MSYTKTPAPCGTLAAWKRHYRRGEKACDQCKAARNQWRAEHDYPKARDRRAAEHAEKTITEQQHAYNATIHNAFLEERRKRLARKKAA